MGDSCQNPLRRPQGREVKAFRFQDLDRVSFPSPGRVETHYVDYSGSKIKIILWPVVPKYWRTEIPYPAAIKTHFKDKSS